MRRGLRASRCSAAAVAASDGGKGSRLRKHRHRTECQAVHQTLFSRTLVLPRVLHLPLMGRLRVQWMPMASRASRFGPVQPLGDARSPACRAHSQSCFDSGLLAEICHWLRELPTSATLPPDFSDQAPDSSLGFCPEHPTGQHFALQPEIATVDLPYPLADEQRARRSRLCPAAMASGHMATAATR